MLVLKMSLTGKDVVKQSPLLGFVCVMIILGIFVNQFPNSQDQFVTVGKDVSCKNDATNQTKDGIVNEYVSTVLVFLLPLFPLLSPPFNKQKMQTAIGHLIGQTGSFGSSEVARHFIVSPQTTFLNKCNITQQECKTLENTTLLLRSNSSTTTSLCQNSDLPFSDIFNSLHGSPHVPSVMFGASMLAFIIAVKYRHQKQGGEEKEKKSPVFNYIFKAILFTSCFVIVTFIVVDMYLKTSNFPSQIVASIVYGMFLQAMVYGFFKQGKEGNVTVTVKMKENEEEETEERNNIYSPPIVHLR